MKKVSIVLALVFCSIALYAQSRPHINLFDNTLNSVLFKELTIEKVGDILGRPSASSSMMVSTQRTSLYYHHRGLEFNFTEGKLDDITIYFGRSWDEINTEWFQVYSGIMTPNVTSDTRVKDMPSLFPDLTMKNETRVYNNVELEWVFYEIGYCSISFKVDPNSKYVDKAIIFIRRN